MTSSDYVQLQLGLPCSVSEVQLFTCSVFHQSCLGSCQIFAHCLSPAFLKIYQLITDQYLLLCVMFIYTQRVTIGTGQKLQNQLDTQADSFQETAPHINVDLKCTSVTSNTAQQNNSHFLSYDWRLCLPASDSQHLNLAHMLMSSPGYTDCILEVKMNVNMASRKKKKKITFCSVFAEVD